MARTRSESERRAMFANLRAAMRRARRRAMRSKRSAKRIARHEAKLLKENVKEFARQHAAELIVLGAIAGATTLAKKGKEGFDTKYKRHERDDLGRFTGRKVYVLPKDITWPPRRT